MKLILRLLVLFGVFFHLVEKSYAVENSSRAFGENYLSIESARNQPFSESQHTFSTGYNSLFFGFRHILEDHWLMGIHSGFKSLKLKETGEEISIFTILQESQLLFRLNDPIYFSAGPKIMYLLPAEGRKIPPRRERRFTREVGAAISVSFHVLLNKDFFLSVRMDRWRGVNRELFQGSETALGLAMRLP